jgi:hypothetical protein
MRKLIWYGMTGVVLLVAGYRALRQPEATSGRDSNPSVEQSSVTPVGQRASSEESSDSGLFGKRCSSDAAERHCCASSDRTAMVARGVIELHGSTVDAPASIYIPEGNDSAAPLPSGEASSDDEQRAAVPARVMPECDDDAVAPTMPPADDDLWPRQAEGQVRPAGWFEPPSQPAADRLMPACREDQNLFQQYPGCPFPGGTTPANKEPSKPGQFWQHEKAPILPLTPEFKEQSAEPVDFEARKWDESAKPATGESNQRQAWWSSALRHTAFKFWLNRDSEPPARQKVDTLELRPGDLRQDEILPEN